MKRKKILTIKPGTQFRTRWIGGVIIEFRNDGPVDDPLTRVIIVVREGHTDRDGEARYFDNPTNASLARVCLAMQKVNAEALK